MGSMSSDQTCDCHRCRGEADPLIVRDGHLARAYTSNMIEVVVRGDFPYEWVDAPYTQVVLASALSADQVQRALRLLALVEGDRRDEARVALFTSLYEHPQFRITQTGDDDLADAFLDALAALLDALEPQP